jgi:hypothetical protein
MNSKYIENQEKIKSENHKLIIYDSKKYKNFIDAIINDDFFSKKLDEYVQSENRYLSLMEISDEVERVQDVADYFSKSNKIVFNFFGIDLLNIYSNFPHSLFGKYHDFDSDIDYVSFVSLILMNISGKYSITDENGQKIFNFSEQVENGIEDTNICFEYLNDLMNVYENMIFKNYFINNLNIIEYLNNICRDEKLYFHKISMIRKISNY